MHPLYLDCNATTPVLPAVREAMQPFEDACFGNPSSRHSFGRQAWSAVEQARETVARLCAAHPDDVLFCSGATEANFTALLGRFEALLDAGKPPETIRVAISAIEHPCVIQCAEIIRRRGATVISIPVTGTGQVDPSVLVGERFDIVSIMAANHETGAIQPLADIASLLDPSRTFFHTDAAQWCNRFEGGLAAWGTHAMSISAHKLYGPRGVGALVVKRDLPIRPLMPGSQEGGYRAGTLNTPAIVGLGTAARYSIETAVEERSRLHSLREKLWNQLSTRCPGLERTLPPETASANTLHVRFRGMKSDRVVDSLDRLGIACSSGPACASGASEPSPVLRAMGFPEEQSREGVRFSLGLSTSAETIEEAAERISGWYTRQVNHVA